MQDSINIFWFRRDLRLNDNVGLFHALNAGKPVLPLFIFDKVILDDLDNRRDKRVAFIHAAVCELQQLLKTTGSSLEVYNGYPEDVFKTLLTNYRVENVFTNHDYESYAQNRDSKIRSLLQANGVGFQTFKDQVIFEKKEVVKDDGQPYTVFTPYSRKWKALCTEISFQSYPSGKYSTNFLTRNSEPVPSLESIGFVEEEHFFPARELNRELVTHYSRHRDYPGIEGTSRLGVHLRFGTVSIRQVASFAQQLSETYVNELVWRDFYQMILWNYPQVGEGKAFKPAYDRIEWRNNQNEFQLWCEGCTGYPIVDAGMRELNATGFMHNRIRMVVASFLTKHLLIDWRWGEAYFAGKLLDYEFASNNGGWQWASGSGCDAAPFFRIFNPYLQTKKFDPDFTYIKKWVPEFQEFTYPKPIVDHEFARKRCLEVYGKALAKQ